MGNNLPNEEDDWRLVNGFADGELTPDDQAELADRMAHEPRLVEGLRRVTTLKNALAELGEAPPESLPRPPAIDRARSLGVGRVAAAVVLLALAAIGVDRASPPNAVEMAVNSHQAFASGRAPDSDGARVRRAALTGQLVVPDLSDAGLRVQYAASERFFGGEALHLGYHGSRGCRVSLWVLPTGRDFGSAPVAGALRASAWQTSQASYLLLANGMPSNRFANVALVAERATRDRRGPDQEMRTVLRSDRAQSEPCAG